MIPAEKQSNAKPRTLFYIFSMTGVSHCNTLQKGGFVIFYQRAYIHMCQYYCEVMSVTILCASDRRNAGK